MVLFFYFLELWKFYWFFFFNIIYKVLIGNCENVDVCLWWIVVIGGDRRERELDRVGSDEKLGNGKWEMIWYEDMEMDNRIVRVGWEFCSRVSLGWFVDCYGKGLLVMFCFGFFLWCRLLMIRCFICIFRDMMLLFIVVIWLSWSFLFFFVDDFSLY